MLRSIRQTRRVSSHDNLAALGERSEAGASAAASSSQAPSGGLKRLVLPRRPKRVSSSPQLCSSEDQAPLSEGARSTAGGLAAALLAVSCAHESVSNPDMSVLLASGGVDVLSAAVCTMPMEAGAKFGSSPAPDPAEAVTAPGAGMASFLRAGDASREAEEASCLASSWEEGRLEEESLLSPSSMLAVRARLTFRDPAAAEQLAAEARDEQWEEAELLESMEDAAAEETKTPRAGSRRARKVRTFFSSLRRRSATDEGSEPGSPREPPLQRAKTSFEVTEHKLYPSLSWCQMNADAVLSVLSPLLASKDDSGCPSPLGASCMRRWTATTTPASIKEGRVRAIEA